jgi:hypothetical protein
MRVAPGFGEKQSTLDDREHGQCQPGRVGFRSQLTAVAHGREAIPDRLLPAVETRAVLISGILLALGALLASALPSAAAQRQVQEVASAPAPVEAAESAVDAS